MRQIIDLICCNFQDLDKLAAQLNELGVVSGNEPPNRPPRAPTNGQGKFYLYVINMKYCP